MISGDCIEYCDNRAICSVDMNRMTYVLHNRSGFIVQKVIIDKILSLSGDKCDFLFNLITKKTTESTVFKNIFVELKGNKTNKAIKQLLNTIIILKDELHNAPMAARIVGTKTAPNYKQTEPYRKLFQLTSGDIIVRTNKYEETC